MIAKPVQAVELTVAARRARGEALADELSGESSSGLDGEGDSYQFEVAQ
jgi:hypothetical protein